MRDSTAAGVCADRRGNKNNSTLVSLPFCQIKTSKAPVHDATNFMASECLSRLIGGDRMNLGKVYARDQRMASQSHPLVAYPHRNVSLLA
jgi:hypothetical protein